MIASKRRLAIFSSAGLPPPAVATMCPLRESVVATLSRIISLSSTMRILLMLLPR